MLISRTMKHRLLVVGFWLLAFGLVSLSPVAGVRAQESRTDKKRPDAPQATPKPDWAAGIARTGASFLFLEDEFYVARVTVSGSLLHSLMALMPDNAELARRLSASTQEALRYRVDPGRQMTKGDAATLVFKDAGDASSVTVYGVMYEGGALPRTVLAYYFWEQSRAYPEYYDEDGAAFMPRMKRPPIEGYQRLGRLFGEGKSPGVDILTTQGAEAVTPFPARVERVNWRPKGEGDCVELEYRGTGVWATFAGLESVSVKVKPGVEVDAGTVVGHVGPVKPGGASALRYELHSAAGDDAPRIDPFAFHLYDTYKIGTGNIAVFRVVKGRIDRLFQQARERAAAYAPSPTPAPDQPSKSE